MARLRVGRLSEPASLESHLPQPAMFPDQPNSAVCTCGYNHAGLPSDVCPECGLHFATANAPSAQTRSWRSLAFVLFLLALFVSLWIDPVRTKGDDPALAYVLMCISFLLISMWLWTGQVLERAQWRLGLLVLPLLAIYSGKRVELAPMLLLQLSLVMWLLGHRRHPLAAWTACFLTFFVPAMLLLVGSTESPYWSRFTLGWWSTRPLSSRSAAVCGGSLALVALLAVVMVLVSALRSAGSRRQPNTNSLK